MASTNLALSFNIITSNTFTVREIAFIQHYLVHGNAAQAVIEAGYTSKAPEKYGRQA